MGRQKRGGRPRRKSGAYKFKPRQYKVTCCVCGEELTVPVAPPPDKKLTCLACLNAAGKNPAQESSQG